MKTTIKRITSILLSATLLLGLVPLNAAAQDNTVPSSPENGIPLVILHINEDAGGEYKTIAEMNASEDHSVRCTGTVEIKAPAGYKSGYGSYTLPTTPLQLDYIRGRGNTTWLAPKKPYKLQFKEKTDLFGMGESKDWALIANTYDLSLVKNRISYWLGEKLGMPFTPQLVPVDVVMEGKNGSEYLGSYYLSENVKIEKSRTNIDKLDEKVAELSGDPNITGGYLLSFYSENQNADEPASTVFTTKAGQTLINDTPSYKSEDELTVGEKAQREYIRNYIQTLEDLIMTEGGIDAATHKKIADMMDLQSAADCWWINEFSENIDAFSTDSTFLYKERNGKLFWGPLWDFDMAWGEPQYEFSESENPNGFTVTNCLWLDTLRDNDPEFDKLIIQRWSVFDKALTELTADGGILDQYRDELKLSQQADYKKWHADDPMYEASTDYDKIINNLKLSIKSRQAVANKYIDLVPFRYATVNYEVDGKIFRTEKQALWSCFVEPPVYPEKEGYVFTGWFEKESHKPLENYYLTGDATFVPEFTENGSAVVATDLFFAKYEDWVSVAEDNYWLESTVLPENATSSRIQLTSSDEKVAVPKDGKNIAIKGVGDVTITGKTHNGITKTLILHVYDPKTTIVNPIKKLKIDTSSITLKKGEYFQPKLTLSPKGACEKVYMSWESSNPDVADANSAGVITAKKNGKATITFTATSDIGKSFSAKCAVTVSSTGTKKNTLTVKAKNVKISAAKLSKGKVKISCKKALDISGAKGKLTFTLVSVSPKKSAAKFSVNKKTGDITVASGLKKGTYKLKLKVKASGNKTYSSAQQTITITIVIK